MGGAERIVFAFRALGESRQAPALAQRADAVAPAGEDLVRIGLMADIPEQPVARRVEQIVQRNSELDHAEPGTQMSAGHRHRADGLGPQFVRDLAEILFGQTAQVGRGSRWYRARAWA